MGIEKPDHLFGHVLIGVLNGIIKYLDCQEQGTYGVLFRLVWEAKLIQDHQVPNGV